MKGTVQNVNIYSQHSSSKLVLWVSFYFLSSSVTGNSLSIFPKWCFMSEALDIPLPPPERDARGRAEPTCWVRSGSMPTSSPVGNRQLLWLRTQRHQTPPQSGVATEVLFVWMGIFLKVSECSSTKYECIERRK